MYPIDKQNLEEDNREGLVYYSKLYLSCMSFSKNKKEVENYKKFHDEFVENIYKQENNFDEKFVEDNFNEEIKKLFKKGKNLEEKIGLLHDLYAKLDYNNEMSNLDRKGL
ncbi:MAG: hypothetical protein IKA31_03555, partial [Clostridia bacterium]|nr:hypothetical protein [Clostridia bacterium]